MSEVFVSIATELPMVAALSVLIIVAGKRIFRLVESMLLTGSEQSKETRKVFRETIDKMGEGTRQALKDITDHNREQLATTLERLELMFGHHTTVLADRMKSVEDMVEQQCAEKQGLNQNIIG